MIAFSNIFLILKTHFSLGEFKMVKKLMHILEEKEKWESLTLSVSEFIYTHKSRKNHMLKISYE